MPREKIKAGNQSAFRFVCGVFVRPVDRRYFKPLSSSALIFCSLVCATRRPVSLPPLISTKVDRRGIFRLVVTACALKVSQSMRTNVIDLSYSG